MRFRLLVDGEPHEVDVTSAGNGYIVHVDGVPYRARVSKKDAEVEVRLGAARHRVTFQGARIFLEGRFHDVVVDSMEARDFATSLRPGGEGGPAVLEVRPPMPGRVVRVSVAPGLAVRRGQTLAVLEAMKMQNEIPAPADGRVRDVRVREGESIGTDRVIAVIEAT